MASELTDELMGKYSDEQRAASYMLMELAYADKHCDGKSDPAKLEGLRKLLRPLSQSDLRILLAIARVMVADEAQSICGRMLLYRYGPKGLKVPGAWIPNR